MRTSPHASGSSRPLTGRHPDQERRARLPESGSTVQRRWSHWLFELANAQWSGMGIIRSADGTTANGSGFQTYQVMPCLIDVATIEEVAGTPSLRKLTALKGD